MLERFIRGFRDTSFASSGGGGGGGDVPASRLVSAGAGLTGGGDLSADRSIALAARYLADNLQQNISAAGANQGAATAIANTSHHVYINGGSAGQGVRLPLSPTVGDTYTILVASSVLGNPNSGTGIAVYPGLGDTFRNRTANIPLTLFAFQTMIVRCIAAGATATWESSVLPGYYDASADMALSVVLNHYATYANTSSVQIYGNLQIFNGAPFVYSGPSGSNVLRFPDNLAEALYIGENTNRYIRFVSTDGSEAVHVDKTFVATTDALLGGRTLKYGYDINDGSGFANNVVAFAGGGQASAVVVAFGVTFVTTVGTAGDSVKLPDNAGAASAVIEVWNTTATSMNLFPPVGGTINGGGLNAAIAVPAGAMAYCRNRGASLTWHVKVIA